MSTQTQQREDEPLESRNVPALGTHWTQSNRLARTSGTLPIHGFKQLADKSCSNFRKYVYLPVDRLAAVQNGATDRGGWCQGLNNLLTLPPPGLATPFRRNPKP